MLKKGVDPNQQFGFDLKTPLHLAIFNIAIGIVDLLIQYKANVNCVSNFKRTLLWYAVIKRSPEIVKHLLKNRACIDQEDSLGRTALYVAIEQADVHMVHLLITNGACVNHRDRQGISPLAYALHLNDQVVLIAAPKKKSTTYLFESRKRGRSVLPSELPSCSKGRNKHSCGEDLEELRHLPNQRGQLGELLIKYGAYIEG
ncbi:MAG: ankyrin repeat domain-containing protein [Amoebophilaceae bacterium]|nr:ankyrin repeat domain-containing protein [Amoebophilaceae bacterium]